MSKKAKKKMKSRYYVLGFIILGFILILVVLLLLYKHPDIPIFSEISVNRNADPLKQEYNECLHSTIDLSKEESVIDYEKQLNKEFKKYHISVLFQTVDDTYSYSYNPNELYYAASTAKILDALYIYQKAVNNELDLNTTIKYTRKYSYSDSEGMETHKFGDEVSLRELVSYAIMYSDNAAHFMLVDYIGLANLRKFSQELGATFYLNAKDYFGSMSVSNALLFLKELHRIISLDNEYSKELNSYFINSTSNYLKVDILGISAATKYGYYDNIFHNIGIVYTEDPYYLIILTKEGGHDFKKVIETINNKLYELYVIRNTAKERICEERVYGV